MRNVLLAVALAIIATTVAAPAMAADLTAFGAISVTGTVFKNVNPPISGYFEPGPGAFPPGTVSMINQTGAYLALRGMLGFNVRANEDLYGVFNFEMDGYKFGEWGATGQKHEIDTAGADRNAVEIKNVYIDFRVPPKLPVWMRVGVQGYYIRPKVFAYFDAAGASARAMIDPIKLSITAYYAKVLDAIPGGSSSGGGDASFWEAVTGSEFYAVDMNVPLTFSPKFTIKPGAFFAYQDIRMDGTNPGIGGIPPAATAVPFANFFPAGVDDAYLWWLGAYANGRFGPFPVEIDFIYQGGRQRGTAAHPELDRDMGSWLIRGWLSYIFKGLEVGTGGMYVQGEDFNTTKIDRFVLPQPVSEAPAITGDSVVFFGGWMGTNLNAHAPCLVAPNEGIPGFWYARAYAYYQVFQWLKVGAQLMYIGSTDRHDANVASPLSGGDPGWYYNATRDADGGDRGIGWEMDYGVNVQLYKNLSFNGAFGYLFAQKALSMQGGVAPSDPWAFVGMLIYTF